MDDFPLAFRWTVPVRTIRLTGSDARRFLHGQSSQAIESGSHGSCLATCLITPTARMRGLALVQLEPELVKLIVISGDAEAIHRALDQVLFPADRVSLEQPQAARLVRFCGAPTGTLSRDGPHRSHWLEPGVNLGAGSDQPALLLPPEADLPAWLEALPELTGPQAERWRIRQGFPAVPAEANEHTNPFELGLASWVSLSKGCYVGQETLAKLATYHGVKQQLRHWRLVGGAVDLPQGGLEPGETLLSPGGERAGVITSSLGDGHQAEGLALVRRQALDQTVLLTTDQRELSISTPPAFVDPPSGPGGPPAAQP